MSAREYYESTPGQEYQQTDTFWQGDQQQPASITDPKHFIPNATSSVDHQHQHQHPPPPQYSSPQQSLNTNTSSQQQQEPLPIPPPKLSRLSISSHSPPVSIPPPVPPEPSQSPQTEESDGEQSTPTSLARVPSHMTSQLRPGSTFYVNEHNHHNRNHHSNMHGNGSITHSRTPSSSSISYSTAPTRSKRRREKELLTYSKETLTQLLLRQEHDAQDSRRLLHIAVSKLQVSAQRLAEADLMKQQFESERKRLLDERVTMNVKVTEALMQAKQDSVNVQQELALVKLKLRHTEDELDRAKTVARSVEEERDEAERAAARARDSARRMREDSAMREARDQGRKEGFEEGIRHGRAIGVARSGIPPTNSALIQQVESTPPPLVVREGDDTGNGSPVPVPRSGTHSRNPSGSQAGDRVSRLDFEESIQRVREEERSRLQAEIDRIMEQEREKAKIALERVVLEEREIIKEIEMRTIQERQKAAETLRVLELEKEKERELRLKEQTEREREREEREHMRRRELRDRDKERERARRERERELEEMRERDRERDEAVAKAAAAASAAAEAAAAATSAASIARTNSLSEAEGSDNENRRRSMPMPSIPYLPMPAPPTSMLPSQSTITAATIPMPNPSGIGMPEPTIPRFGSSQQQPNLPTTVPARTVKKKQRRPSIDSTNSLTSNLTGFDILSSFEQMQNAGRSGSSGSATSAGGFYTRPSYARGDRGDELRVIPEDASLRTISPEPARTYNRNAGGMGMPEPSVPRFGASGSGVGMPVPTNVKRSSGSSTSNSGIGMPAPSVPSFGPGAPRGGDGPGIPTPTIPNFESGHTGSEGGRSVSRASGRGGVGMPEPTVGGQPLYSRPSSRATSSSRTQHNAQAQTSGGQRSSNYYTNPVSGRGMPEPTVPSIVSDSSRRHRSQQGGTRMPEPTVPSIVSDSSRRHRSQQGGTGMPEPTVPSIVMDDRSSRRTGERSGRSGSAGGAQMYMPAMPRPMDMDYLNPAYADRGGSGNGGRGDLSRSDSHNSSRPSLQSTSSYEFVVEPPSEPTSPGSGGHEQQAPQNNYLSPLHATIPMPQVQQHHQRQQQQQQQPRRQSQPQSNLPPAQQIIGNQQVDPNAPTEPNSPTDDAGGLNVDTLPPGFVAQAFTPNTAAATLPSSGEGEMPPGFVPQAFTPHTATLSMLPTDNDDQMPPGFVPTTFTPHTSASATLPSVAGGEIPPGFVPQTFTPHTAARSMLPSSDNDDSGQMPPGFIPQSIRDARTGVTTPLVGATGLPSLGEEASSRRTSVFGSQNVPGGFGGSSGGGGYYSPYRPSSSPLSNEPPVIPTRFMDDEDGTGGSSGRQRTSIYGSGPGAFTPGGSSRSLPGVNRSNGTPAGGGVYQNPLRGDEDEDGDGEADNLLARNTQINATAHAPNAAPGARKTKKKKR